MYLALYRKYRPRKFDEVIGQDHIIKTLQNQIKLNKIGHAYLFCGSRGTGKTSTAKIFAREINCSCGGKGTCAFCQDKLSLDVLEIDAASNNGVDEIRDLREKVKYPPVDGKYKVYIIDEVHMLSASAFNALLKTLEEPPKHAIFILATTEVHKLPATILSRCMRFDFKLVSLEDLIKLLKKVFDNEKITYDDESLALIARAGEGSVRDTLSIADRAISFAGEKLTRQNVIEILGETERQSLISLTDTFLNGKIGEALMKVNSILESGKSPLVLSKDIIYYLRDLLLINVLGNKATDMIFASKEDYELMKNQAIDNNYSKITWAITLFSEIEQDLRYSNQPRVVLETAIIKLFSRMSLEERVEKLEKLLNGQNSMANKPITSLAANTNDGVKEEKTIAKEETIVEKAQTIAGSNDKILGDLLNYVKEQKFMSLLMACRQIWRLSITDGTANLFIKDDSAINMIKSNKYSPVVDEYFKSINLKWKIVDSSNPEVKRSGSISDRLGGRV